MLKCGQRYIDKGSEYYEHRYRRQQIEFLSKKAAKLGLQITLAHSWGGFWRGEVNVKMDL